MLRFLYNLARILFIVVIVRAVYQWLFHRSPQSRQASSAPPIRIGETRRDPVCGTFVSTELSVRALVKGSEKHFCSSTCRDKYLAA